MNKKEIDNLKGRISSVEDDMDSIKAGLFIIFFIVAFVFFGWFFYHLGVLSVR